MTPPPAMRIVRYAAPGWGVGELMVARGVLVAHDVPRRRREAGGEELELRPGDDELVVAGVPLPALVERLVAYYGGSRDPFLDLDLGPTYEALATTAFETRAIEEMRRVPYGGTVSYRDLAQRAGRERAARAAGNVCARGTLELIVPYHRVIASDGTIGSYGSGGPGVKRRLLLLEGVRL